MLYGISSGALRAAMFAERHPERVARLALDSFVWTGKGSPTLAERKKKLPEFQSKNRRPIDRAFIRSMFDRDHPGCADDATIDAFASAILALDDSVPTGTYVDMCSKLPLVDPAKIKVPTIVMRGEFDGIAGIEDLLEFFRAAAASRQAVHRDGRHLARQLPAEELPDACTTSCIRSIPNPSRCSADETLSLSSLVGMALAVQGLAQTYPSRPVRIVVPLSPGGFADTPARMLAPRLSEQLGRQFFVENKPGAGGTIGWDFAAKSAPDGHTLVITGSTHLITAHLYKNLALRRVQGLHAHRHARLRPVRAGGQSAEGPGRLGARADCAGEVQARRHRLRELGQRQLAAPGRRALQLA